jgi:hypothetical protein
MEPTDGRLLSHRRLLLAGRLLLAASGLFVSALSVILVGAPTASAQNLNALLHGSYAFTGPTGCLYAPGSASSAPSPGNTTPLPNAGFNSNNQPIVPGTSFSNSNAVEGIRVFNGDGTGSVKGTEAGATARPTPGPTGYPAFPPAAESANFSYRFTYTVNPDGSWTSTMVAGSYIGKFVTGPRTGQTYTTTIPELSGLIGSFGQTLTASNLTPTVEIQIFSNGDAWPRICHRSRVYTDMDTWNQKGK